MKKFLIYLLLVTAIPSMAQVGHPGGHHHPSSHNHSAHHHHAHHESHHAPAPYEEPGMRPADYDAAVRIISNESFDSKRLTIAKQIVVDNVVSARQIAGICRLFSFESNRLEFAKFAYPSCVDKNNYFLLNEVFTFDSSKKELNKFIHKP